MWCVVGVRHKRYMGGARHKGCVGVARQNDV